MAEKVNIVLEVTGKNVKVLQNVQGNLKKVQSTSKGMKGALQNFKKNWLGVTAAVGGAVFAMGKAIKAASDLQEEGSKFNTVFGTSEKVIGKANKAVKDLTKSYAMSEREAKQNMAQMQDLLKPLGIMPEKAAELSEQVVKLSADMGSFNNMPSADIMNDIQSALVGMNRPMMKYGSVLSAACVKQKALNMGLIKQGQELTASARAQAALTMIMETQTDAQGDMIRTGGSYANQLKFMKASIEDVSASIGKALLPVMTGIIGVVQKFKMKEPTTGLIINHLFFGTMLVKTTGSVYDVLKMSKLSFKLVIPLSFYFYLLS